MNTDPVCEGECAEGHLCQEGSVTSTPLTCGNVTVYCPKGSSVPTLVKSGYYTIGFGASQNSDVSAQNTQTGEEQCEPGTYCVGGVRFLCPPGKYGASAGATTSECSGKTHAGFFSPLEAETNPRPNRCAAGKSDPLSWYCPSGSTRPHPVSVGYFSIGPGLKDIYASEPGTEVVGPPANDTQVGQKVSPGFHSLYFFFAGPCFAQSIDASEHCSSTSACLANVNNNLSLHSHARLERGVPTQPGAFAREDISATARLRRRRRVQAYVKQDISVPLGQQALVKKSASPLHFTAPQGAGSA